MEGTCWVHAVIDQPPPGGGGGAWKLKLHFFGHPGYSLVSIMNETPGSTTCNTGFRIQGVMM
jgi:hypothetical protein